MWDGGSRERGGGRGDSNICFKADEIEEGEKE